MKLNPARLFPPLEWGRGYGREILASDTLAAVIVTIMLIPQSLAYALLAGLPAEMGLYASILPLVAYALLPLLMHVALYRSEFADIPAEDPRELGDRGALVLAYLIPLDDAVAVR